MDSALTETRHPVLDRVVTLRMHRPAVRNALRPEDIDTLRQSLARLQCDPRTAVIVITGSGDCFTSGADIGALNALDGEAVGAYMDATTDVLSRILMMRKIVVAAVNGTSAGLGNHIAVCADLCLMREDAALHFTGSAKSIPSMMIGAALMPLSIGMKRAKSLYLRGGSLKAQQALDWGLCNDVVPAEAWQARLDDLTGELQGKASLTLAHNKFQLNQCAFQMLGASRLSVLAGAVQLVGRDVIPTGRVGAQAGP